jgi:hypothetical protein
MAEPKRHIPVETNPQLAAGGIAARALHARGASYLADLNPEQRQAVEALDGPVLVLAGAGTGKTRVLTTRIAHILNLGRARPSEILAVTFTNKAAREMKERVGQMVGQVVEGMPWLGTFHSIGGRILRTHAELVQLKSNFTVLDVDDQVRLLALDLRVGVLAGIGKLQIVPAALEGCLEHCEHLGVAVYNNHLPRRPRHVCRQSPLNGPHCRVLCPLFNSRIAPRAVLPFPTRICPGFAPVSCQNLTDPVSKCYPVRSTLSLPLLVQTPRQRIWCHDRCLQ